MQRDVYNPEDLQQQSHVLQKHHVVVLHLCVSVPAGESSSPEFVHT